MQFQLFHSKYGPVGIDFGSRGVRLLQLRDHGAGYQPTGASRVEPASTVDDPEYAAQLSDALRTALASGRFTGRRCIVSLHREDVSIQSIRVPRMEDHELRTAVEWEAADRFGLDRENLQVDYIRLGEVQQGNEVREEVLLVAASRDRINARLEPILSAGLRPVALETNFTAAARCFSQTCRRDADQERVRVIVDVGVCGSTIMILRGDKIAFCKAVELGGRNLDQAVAEHLQIAPEAANELRARRLRNDERRETSPTGSSHGVTERAVFEAVRPLLGQLVKELSLCMRYYGVTFRGAAPESIIVTGGEGLEPRFDEMLEQSCKTPVVGRGESHPLREMLPQIQQMLGRSPGPAESWAVAAGLSMRGISDAKARNKSPEIGAKRNAA